MNPNTLKYLMGHTDISVTLNTYTHLELIDAEQELERMQREVKMSEVTCAESSAESRLENRTGRKNGETVEIQC